MDKELLDGYIKSIEEELRMMQGKNITTQFLNYLDCLMHTYKKLEKMKNKDEHEKSNEYGEEIGKIEGTMVDENLLTAFEEYKAYIKYKNEHKKTNRDSDLEKSHDELEHFLMAISDIFAEIEECSRDNMEERSMVKKYIKTMFQSFD